MANKKETKIADYLWQALSDVDKHYDDGEWMPVTKARLEAALEIAKAQQQSELLRQVEQIDENEFPTPTDVKRRVLFLINKS